MSFANDFVWGAATASYQVEGAAFEGGKGKSIWDVFSHDPGNTHGGHTGDVSCDQYHRYKEDIALMKELGIKAYRFSVSWPRIMPEGTGAVNQEGIDYYNRLIDELIANDIEPYLTMYHWDLPYALHLQGGWMNPAMQKWFSDYAKVIADNFTDRVSHIFTINEPQCIIGLGYLRGIHAPGLKVGPTDFFGLWHNLLMANGRATQTLREYAKQPLQIGMAPCGGIYAPVSDKPEDIEAARLAQFSIPSNDLEAVNWDVAMNCDPLYKGEYPEDVLRAFGQYFPKIGAGDMDVIRQKMDFHGQNIYNCVPIKAGADGKPVRADRHEGFPKTAIQWPVTPEALYWGPKFICDRYDIPFYITENGMSAHDWVSLDGKVHDPNRVDFMQRYIGQYQKLAEEGYDLKGYFAWSLLDNYEWHSGYDDRFGLIYVDYQTQKRTIKDSGYFYRDVIAANKV